MGDTAEVDERTGHGRDHDVADAGGRGRVDPRPLEPQGAPLPGGPNDRFRPGWEDDPAQAPIDENPGTGRHDQDEPLT